MAHTKEPWPHFADMCKPVTSYPESAPTARLSPDDYNRARACVNACAGISTEHLEKNGENLTAIARALAAGCDAWERIAGRIIGTIPDSQVLTAAGTVGGMVSYFENLHAQRDQLLAALKKARHELLLKSPEYGRSHPLDIEIASAIAAAKGPAA
ncbi:hypothetical protein JFK97_06630 [Chromobacterium phragmitis]|uniref:hypothetical protein n=1 Tax=Chromobacterium amazonense TaxID=1382803 RepID=UPI0021B7B1C6|nr:hypothetical protein [Chromobacterium amazonense]MBM2884062.1 hypothetical protein [Chromobacterium amazonense]